MKIQNDPPLHLTYCLNVHPGETWQENLAAIRDHALAVRKQVAADQTFGLGLRLSRQAADALCRPDQLKEFSEFLAANNLYAFTINGFPYGTFHGTAVKQEVYRPDWRGPDRRDYTIRLANILAALLPEGVSGSISTVPGAYKAWIRTEADVLAMAQTLAETAMHLEVLRRTTGKEICLALEPEPDCYLENTDECVAFFSGPLRGYGIEHLRARFHLAAGAAEEVLRRHVGVCFDTSHLAVEFEDLAVSLSRLKSAGIRVGKVQISSALRCEPTLAALERLEPFCEGVYLHQAKALKPSGEVVSFADLPEAISAVREGRVVCRELRVHFHVPLFFESAGPLRSTSELLKGSFASAVRGGITPHLEIETYTFNVLPDAIRPAGITECLVREYRWVLDLLGQ